MKSVCHFLLALCLFHFLPAQSPSYIIAGQTSGPMISHHPASLGDSLVNTWFPSANAIELDLDSDSVRDFKIRIDAWGQVFGTTYSDQYALAYGANDILQSSDSSFTWSYRVYPYQFGDTIYPHDPANNIAICGLTDRYWPQYFGWPSNSDSIYMGIRLHGSQGIVLGWIQIRVDLYSSYDSTLMDTMNYYYVSHVIDWAYGHTYVGIEEERNAAAIKLYPVPAKGSLRVSSQEGDQIEAWQIADLAGKICLKGDGIPSNAIDISDLPAGLYIFEGSNMQGIVRRKFLKE